MRTYVKLLSEPKDKAVDALEKLAVGMNEVCIMHTYLANVMMGSEIVGGISGGGAGTDVSGATTGFGYGESGNPLETVEGRMKYFSKHGEIGVERCKKIISESKEELGENDFFFEWFEKPSDEEVKKLKKKIDEVLKPIGVKYEVFTK